MTCGRVASWAVGLTLVACGGEFSSEGSTGGTSGSGGASGSGGTGGGCTTGAGPVATTFHFKNSGMTTVYLREECRLRYDVTSCVDGFTAPLVLDGTCTVACDDPSGGCIACGACFSGMRAVAPGDTLEQYWDGNAYSFDTNASGCQCHDAHPQAPGRYDLVVPIWHSEPAGGPADPDRVLTLHLDLGAGSNDVAVDLAQ